VLARKCLFIDPAAVLYGSCESLSDVWAVGNSLQPWSDSTWLRSQIPPQNETARGGSPQAVNC
jgi:hypothetical protein